MLQCSTASKRVCFAHLPLSFFIEWKGYFSKKHFWSAMGMRLPHTVEPGGCFFRECPPWGSIDVRLNNSVEYQLQVTPRTNPQPSSVKANQKSDRSVTQCYCLS